MYLEFSTTCVMVYVYNIKHMKININPIIYCDTNKVVK